VITALELLGAAILAAGGVVYLIRRAEIRYRARYGPPPKTERDEALAQLGTPARERAKALSAKCAKALAAYGEDDDLILDGNRRALEALSKMHLNLLVAQRDLVTLEVVKDAPSLRKQLTSTEEAVAIAETAELRESRAATEAILRRRLGNVARREALLAQIESDLQRIEAHVDLALEDATLGRAVAPLPGSIQLASGLFDESLREE
jgi:hypothetical protein